MDRFEAMRVFSRVAHLGGFAAASRELRMSTSAVSRHVGQLEDHLGLQLLTRTTRQVSLTDSGREYLARCDRILDDVNELEGSLADGRRSPRGRLRVSAGVSFAQEQLNQFMPTFLNQYPDVEVELLLTDRHIDLVGEGVDAALRIGRLSDSSLVARRLCPCRFAVCAPPAYIERVGAPSTPADVASHRCIVDTNQPASWRFAGPDGDHSISVAGPYRVNSANAAAAATMAGVGLAYLPTFVAGRSLERGDLVALFADFEPVEVSVYAVYPESRYPSAGVRAFVDALARAFGGEPPWDRWRQAKTAPAPAASGRSAR